MSARKGKTHLQNALTRFTYDHIKSGSRIAKIRKSADETAKILNTIAAPKTQKNEK